MTASVMIDSYTLHCGPQRRIPDIINCNLKKDYRILIIFGTNIPDTTGRQTTVQVPTSPSVKKTLGEVGTYMAIWRSLKLLRIWYSFFRLQWIMSGIFFSETETLYRCYSTCIYRSPCLRDDRTAYISSLHQLRHLQLHAGAMYCIGNAGIPSIITYLLRAWCCMHAVR